MSPLQKGDISKVSNQSHSSQPLQVIYFGAPGSGKSYKVKKDRLKGVPEENIFRTTFHPDSDYASFVGCYKPIVRQAGSESLSYEELLDLVKELELVNTYQIPKFSAKYYSSLRNLDEEQKKQIREQIQALKGKA